MKSIFISIIVVLSLSSMATNALAERILVIGGDTGNQATNDIIYNQVAGLSGTVDRAEWLVYRTWTSEYIINNYDVIVLSHIINESLFSIDWKTRLKPFLYSGKAIIWEAPMNLSTDIRTDYGIDVRGAFYVPGGIPTTGLRVLPNADSVLINNLSGNYNMVDGMFLSFNNAMLTPFVNIFYAATGELFTYGIYGEFGGGRIVITGTADDDAGLSTGTATQQNHYQQLVNKLLWVGGRSGIADPNAVIIPDWKGLSQADAITAINDLLGKSPDFISTSVTNLYVSGTVSDHQPSPGSAAMANDPNPVFVSISVVAQRTGDPVTVPNVTGMTSYTQVDDALDAADGVVDGLGLQRYCCPSTYNPTIPADTIITQYPKAGAQSTTDWIVDVVMSLGPNPGLVPGLKWMTQVEAESTVSAAGYLVGQIVFQNNEAVEAGIVLSQIPEQHDALAQGGSIDIIVSAGPVGTVLVVVPDVVGQSAIAAAAILANAGLNSSVITAFSDTVAEGDVISQTPVAGTEAVGGSAVELLVSSGPAPIGVAVPDVVGLTQPDAQIAISSSGLVLGNVTSANNDTVPVGNVISQTPAAGTDVATGSVVDLVISSGPAPITIAVPDVVGLSQADAETAISSTGLVLGTVSSASSNVVPLGNVISQTPASGIEILEGSSVDLVVSSGPDLVTVPNVIGQRYTTAISIINNAGLTVGNVSTVFTRRSCGWVRSQSPLAGSNVSTGSTINLVVTRTRFCNPL